jgi:hypothetical protein
MGIPSVKKSSAYEHTRPAPAGIRWLRYLCPARGGRHLVGFEE